MSNACTQSRRSRVSGRHRWLAIAVLGWCAATVQTACLGDAEVQYLGLPASLVVNASFK
jgi:hypothetical protein